jgi:formylglycine-generating enzyme required for sulfatase activity/uncharacterized caspase-like protein
MAKNWAICIGINEYAHLKPLDYARQDAQRMYDFLEAEKFDRVLLFFDPDPKNNSPEAKKYPSGNNLFPSGNNLRYAIESLKEKAKLADGDNFWFFFSGHGMRYGDKDYLMPIDGIQENLDRPENLDRFTLSVDFVIDNLRASGADNVILFLDACRNEGSKDGEGIGRQTREKAKETGVICFFSCQPREFSYEIQVEGKGTGAFTYALQEGLSEQYRCATVKRLSQHLRDRVPELLRQYRPRERQTPETIADPDYKSRLLLLPKYAAPVDIAALKNDAYKASWLEPNLEVAERLWHQVIEAAYASGEPDKDAIRALQKIFLLREEPLQTFSFEVVTVNRKGEIVQRESRQARYFREDCNGVPLDLIAIPGGTFWMGTEDAEIERLCKQYGKDYFRRERPQHKVTVKPFLMGKYPVTQAQWKAIASRTDLKVNRDLNPDPARFKGNNRPVEQVSWYDAVEFCARLSRLARREYRLPSEAEWEYACRAGTTTPFDFGETITPNLANYDGNYTYADEPKGEYRQETTPVGSFPPNAFGLYDLHGNVWEWCWDDWHENYEGAPNDGKAWLDNNNSQQAGSKVTANEKTRVSDDPTLDNTDENISQLKLLRGGSWYNFALYCRSAYRSRSDPDNRDNSVGCRVVAV